MPDSVFEALIVAGLAILLWHPAISWRRAAAGGLVLGASATVAQVGEALLVPAVIFLLAAGGGWRRAVGRAAVLGVAFVAPIVGYSAGSDLITGSFFLSHTGVTSFYGRAAAAADCATVRLPAAERGMCPTRAQQAQRAGLAGVRRGLSYPAVLPESRPRQDRQRDRRLQPRGPGPAARAAARGLRAGRGEAVRADQDGQPWRHADLALAVPAGIPLLPAVVVAAGRHEPRSVSSAVAASPAGLAAGGRVPAQPISSAGATHRARCSRWRRWPAWPAPRWRRAGERTRASGRPRLAACCSSRRESSSSVSLTCSSSPGGTSCPR